MLERPGLKLLPARAQRHQAASSARFILNQTVLLVGLFGETMGREGRVVLQSLLLGPQEPGVQREQGVQQQSGTHLVLNQAQILPFQRRQV